MSEALNMILKFAFEKINLDQVYALILNDNIASQKVARANNLVYSRVVENYKDDVYEGPIDKYKITKAKWFEINGNGDFERDVFERNNNR